MSVGAWVVEVGWSFRGGCRWSMVLEVVERRRDGVLERGRWVLGFWGVWVWMFNG